MIKILAPIKFTVDEEGGHVREHWTLPIIYSDGIFNSFPCKDAGLRVALNLAECIQLGLVSWSGEAKLINEFKLQIILDSLTLKDTIMVAVGGLQAIYN